MDGETVFVAYQDQGDMIPVSEDGHLVTFATLEEADKAKGALGVVAPQTPLGLRIAARQHGLKLPCNGNGRM